MSRIIVKNLPVNLTERELKQHFSTRGEVTDIKLAKTASGKSRKFAFIGFRESDQATSAVSFFDGSYLKTSKLVVEIAKRVGDESLQNNKNKQSNNDEKDEKTIKSKPGIKSNKSEINNKQKKDKLKDEFMSTMKGGKSKGTAAWANDGDADGYQNIPANNIMPEDTDEEESDNDDNNDDVNDFTTKPKRKENKSDSSSSSDSDDDDDDDDKEEGVEIKSAEMSDMDFLRSKIVQKADLSDSDDGASVDGKKDKDNGNDSDSDGSSSSDSDSDSDSSSDSSSDSDSDGGDDQKTMEVGEETLEEEVEEQEQEEEEDDLEASGRLFLRNLPYTCTEDDIVALFESFGEVRVVHVPIDEMKRSKGYGFVTFMFPEEAEKALNALDGSSFQGRLLHILPAKSETKKVESSNVSPAYMKGMSEFQIKREETRKKQAQNGDMKGQNTSYLRTSAAVNSLAGEHGVDAGELIDVANQTGGEVALRVALSETHVLQQNTEFFKSHGVDTNLLFGTSNDDDGKTQSKEKSRRSTRTIMVKNLPNDAVEDEVSGLFLRHGVLTSFLLPDSKTVAVVQFSESSEARSAFRALAYRRYKHVPLYLEWLPDSVIDSSKATATQKVPMGKTNTNAMVKAALEDTADDNADNTTSSVEQTCVYVKNLNFNTTEDSLRMHLRTLGIQADYDVRAISLPKNNYNSNQNSGFGFIEFLTQGRAKGAIKALHGSTIEGHVLEAKLSGKKLSSTSNATEMNAKDAAIAKKLENHKLLVRNVAFQATEKEIRALFENFGVVKRVRIPKKAGGNHRGFAFVDFTSPAEALSAKTSLASTHFYGRHLVIEWASEELTGNEDIAAMRKRVADDALKLARVQSRQNKRKANDNDGEGGGGGGIDGNGDDPDLEFHL